MSFIEAFIGLSPEERDACLEFSETHWTFLMRVLENDEAQEHAQDEEEDEAQEHAQDQAETYAQYLQRYPKRSPIFLAIFLLSKNPEDSDFLSRAEAFLNDSSTDQLQILVRMLQSGFKECGLTGIFDPDHNQHLLFKALTNLFIDGLICIYGDDDVSLKLKNQYRDFMLSLIHAPGIFDYILLAFPAQCGEEMLSLLIQSQDRDLLSAVLMKLECCLGQTFTLNQLNSDEKILILPEDYGLDDGGELAEDFSLEISELSVSKVSWSLKSILRYLVKHGDQDQSVSQFFCSITMKSVEVSSFRAYFFPLSYFLFFPAVGGIEIFSTVERLKIASLSPETREFALSFCKSCIFQDGKSIDITMLMQTLLGLQQKTRLENIRSSVLDVQDDQAARAVDPSVLYADYFLTTFEKVQLNLEYIELLNQDTRRLWPSVLLSQFIGHYMNQAFHRSALPFIIKAHLYCSNQFSESVDNEYWLRLSEDRFEVWSREGFPKQNQDAFDAVCRLWFENFSKIFNSKGREDLEDILKSLEWILAGHAGQAVQFLNDCMVRFSQDVAQIQDGVACSPPCDRPESPESSCYAPPTSFGVVDTTAVKSSECAAPAVEFAALPARSDQSSECAAPAVEFAALPARSEMRCNTSLLGRSDGAMCDTSFLERSDDATCDTSCPELSITEAARASP